MIKKAGDNIANYLITHYKGKYKLLAPYDKRTNQFPRKLDGTFEDIDVYISCANNITISYFGKSILEVYIPSIGRGRNVVKAIQSELGDNIIFNIKETSQEVLFQFKAQDMEKLEKYLKPKTNCANRSPFSNKNLPKTKYKIPDEDLLRYKDLMKNLSQKEVLSFGLYTNNFIKSLVSKKNTLDNIKADMAVKGLKGKEYIHSIGKWIEYIEYLKKEINKK